MESDADALNKFRNRGMMRRDNEIKIRMNGRKVIMVVVPRFFFMLPVGHQVEMTRLALLVVKSKSEILSSDKPMRFYFFFNKSRLVVAAMASRFGPSRDAGGVVA